MLLFSPTTVYALDRATIEIDDISEVELMRRAGESVWRAIVERWPQTNSVTLLAGPGNNGGDAYVVALCAARHGVKVQLLVEGDLSRQSVTAASFRQQWLDRGGEESAWGEQAIEGELIVDGLLGIGLDRSLNEHWISLINTVNDLTLPRVAIDIPSGLNASTGVPQPVAVKADLTVTFIGRKIGLYLADGPDFCGETLYEDLGSTQASQRSDEARAVTLDAIKLPAPRPNNAHKNQFGHIMIVGGGRAMSGAVALAARAALRSGAGLVSAFVAQDNRWQLAAVPEIMVDSWERFAEQASRASVVLVGPGLVDCGEIESCLQVLEKLEVPVVVDAGALVPQVLVRLQRQRLLLTPHPGEAARLLDVSTDVVQSDRLAAVEKIAESFQATCVLKGSGSLVAGGRQPAGLNLWGNPGMATAGSGDVLAGIIAALLAQGLSDRDAMEAAVVLHAQAADYFCRDKDPMALMASDIIERIPETIFRMRRNETPAG